MKKLKSLLLKSSVAGDKSPPDPFPWIPLEKIEQLEVFNLLDLISHPHLSREVARHFDVPHQSPQVLILEGDRVRDHDSHGGIDRLRPDLESKNPA